MKLSFSALITTLLLVPVFVQAQSVVPGSGATTTARYIEGSMTVEALAREIYGNPLCWTVIGNANPAVPIERSTDLIGSRTLSLPPRATCDDLIARSSTAGLRLVERTAQRAFAVSPIDALEDQITASYTRRWQVEPAPYELLSDLLLASPERSYASNKEILSTDRWSTNWNVFIDNVFDSRTSPMYASVRWYGGGQQIGYAPMNDQGSFQGSYWETQKERLRQGPLTWMFGNQWTWSVTGKIQAVRWQRHQLNTNQEDDQFFYNINGKDQQILKYADGLFISPNEKRYAYRAQERGKNTWYIQTNTGRLGPYRYVSIPLFTQDNLLIFVVVTQKKGRDVYTIYTDGKAGVSWDYIDSITLTGQGKTLAYRAMRRDAKGVDRWYMVRGKKLSQTWDYVDQLIADPYQSKLVYQTRKDGTWFLVENEQSWSLHGEADTLFLDLESATAFATSPVNGEDGSTLYDPPRWIQRRHESWLLEAGERISAFSRTGQILTMREEKGPVLSDVSIAIRIALNGQALPPMAIATNERSYREDQLQAIRARYPIFVYPLEEAYWQLGKSAFFDAQDRLTLYQGDGRYLLKVTYERVSP